MNDDADVNVEADKIYEDNNYMIISMEDEQNTLEYQETMKVDVENTSPKKTYGDQYMQLFMLNFLQKQKNPLEFLTNVEIIQTNLSSYRIKSKYI